MGVAGQWTRWAGGWNSSAAAATEWSGDPQWNECLWVSRSIWIARQLAIEKTNWTDPLLNSSQYYLVFNCFI